MKRPENAFALAVSMALRRLRRLAEMAPKGSALKRKIEEAYEEVTAEADLAQSEEQLRDRGSKVRAALGGRKGSTRRKIAAEDWQHEIEPKVKRSIEAGKKDSDIAGRVIVKAGRDLDTVRRFVAKVRRELTAKK